MAADDLTPEDKEFLAKCEEELKDRFTEKDAEFMKAFNAEKSTPPIVDPWWVSNAGRRNDRRDNRRNHPYVKYRNREQYQYERQNYRRGYNDYNQQYDNAYGYRNQQPKYF